MEYQYLKEPLENYITRLSAKTPCPGGGSASILSIALANALIQMACNFSVESKKISDESRKVVREILSDAIKIQQILNKSIEQDSIIYQSIQETMRKKKESPGMLEEYQCALKKSAGLHMDMLDYCMKMLEWNEKLIENCNPYLISDVGVSAALIEGALSATRINVMVNLADIGDKDYISDIIKKLDETCTLLFEKAKNIAKKIEHKIMKK